MVTHVLEPPQLQGKQALNGDLPRDLQVTGPDGQVGLVHYL